VAVGCHYFLPGLQLPSQPLRGLLPILLLGEQRHDGCEQFAYDCYPTALRLRFEPGPSVPEFSMLTTRLPSHPYVEGVKTLSAEFTAANRYYACKEKQLLSANIFQQLCHGPLQMEKGDKGSTLTRMGVSG